MFLLRCSTHCLPSLQWIINLYSMFLVVFGWKASTYILGSLVLPPRIVKFSREEALSYSFWYLSSYKNIVFNKAYILKMFIEWIHESHRFYLVQWLEIQKKDFGEGILSLTSQKWYRHPPAQFWDLWENCTYLL